MAEKKISFGFKQVKKQPLLLPIKQDDDKEKRNGVELIQCLEGQTIKLVHEKEEEKPLVIPLLNSQKTSSALAVLKNLKNVLTGDEEPDDSNQKQKSNAVDSAESTNANSVQLSLEQRVIKELLNEAQNADGDSENTNNEKLSLPLTADTLSLDGAKESSIDDYEKIPIAQFGLAMLRGMGLKDEEIKAGQNKEPELRPKGMGLGADKVVKKQKLLVAPAANETLEIKKNAYVRILGGKHKDLYGQIEGLDDHACRVIVRLALGGIKEAFNEFMVQAISKQEYQQYGKVINSTKYEEYKRKQEEKDAKRDIKTEIKTEVKREKMSPSNRSNENSRSNRDASPKYSKNRNEYAGGSRRRSRDRSRDRNEIDRNRDSKRSPSHDGRNKTNDSDRDAQNRRHDNRRSRSMDRYNTRDERSKDVIYSSRRHGRSPSRSKSESSSDDNSSDVRHNQHKKSHHKKSKKSSKQKKKSSKKYDSSDDDRHIKKKTKKSKRERSRSR